MTKPDPLTTAERTAEADRLLLLSADIIRRAALIARSAAYEIAASPGRSAQAATIKKQLSRIDAALAIWGAATRQAQLPPADT